MGQPRPKRGAKPVTAAVIRSLQARRRAGVKTYGRVLETHNGRDAMWDLFEELVDAAQYAAQVIMERDPDGKLRPRRG